jgi:hypothetical protein
MSHIVALLPELAIFTPRYACHVQIITRIIIDFLFFVFVENFTYLIDFCISYEIFFM